MRNDVNPIHFESVPAERAAQAGSLCDVNSVKTWRTYAWMTALALLAAVTPIGAQPVPEQPDPADAMSSVSNEPANAAPIAESAEAAPNETATSTNTNESAATEEADATASTKRPEPSANKTGFAAFEVIAQRNIFNGNRSGQRISSTRGSSQQRSVQVDAFSLVGTMISEKGSVAFFDGTDPGFREALKPGGRIAGFEVRDVRYAGVRLAQGTNTVDLAVGTGLRRENGGLWKHSAESPSFASTSSSRSSDRSFSSSESSSRFSSRSSRSSSRDYNFSSESSPAGNVSATDVNEVLKRLMEQREKE